MNITFGSRRRGDVGIYVGRGNNPFSCLAQPKDLQLYQYSGWLWSEMKANNPEILKAMTALIRHEETHGELKLIGWCWPGPDHTTVLANALKWYKNHSGMNQVIKPVATTDKCNVCKRFLEKSLYVIGYCESCEEKS